MSSIRNPLSLSQKAFLQAFSNFCMLSFLHLLAFTAVSRLLHIWPRMANATTTTTNRVNHILDLLLIVVFLYYALICLQNCWVFWSCLGFEHHLYNTFNS